MVYFLLYTYYTLYYTVLIFLLRQKYATYCAISQTFLPRFLPAPLSKIAKIPEIVSGIVNESVLNVRLKCLIFLILYALNALTNQINCDLKPIFFLLRSSITFSFQYFDI